MGSTSASTEGSPPSGEVTSGERTSGDRPSGDGSSDGRPSGGGAPVNGRFGEEDSTERVLVGLITRPHGLRGDIKVDVLSDVPDRFAKGRELLLVGDGQSARRVRVAGVRPTRGGAIVRFEGCETREQAETLRGRRLEVPRSEVPTPPAGLYYHFDLVDCRCVDADRGDLGIVAAVVEDGGGVLLEIARDASGSSPGRGASETSPGRVLLVPFVEAFLESVDVAGKEIRFRLPPGLVEACESKS